MATVKSSSLSNKVIVSDEMAEFSLDDNGMKPVLATVIFLFLSIMVARTSISAQTPVVLDTNPAPMEAPQTLVKTSGTATARYNKFKDVTYATSSAIRLKIGDTGWGTLNAGFTSKGNGVIKPDSIMLRLFTAAKDRSFVDKPDAVVIVDGKRIFDGKAKITEARTNGVEFIHRLSSQFR